MLSIDEYNYIKLLYDKLLKMNNYINTLMKNGEWDSVEYAVGDKDKLMKQIAQFEKVHSNNIKDNHELMRLRYKITDLEKSNIELLKIIREEMKNELSSVSSSKKFLNTYEPSSGGSLSTINVKDDDD